MMPLCANKIRETLLTQPDMPIVCLDTVDSTNQFLKTYSTDAPVVLCCAETQTQGRGRQGNTWCSPQNGNLYYSLRCPLPRSINQLSPLSLITALSLVRVFEKTENMMVKWPNDLIIKEKKCGGILIEILDKALIIGVGINLHTAPKTDQPTTSLQGTYDRNTLLATLITTQLADIEKFTTQGLSTFEKDWEKVDALKGKIITRQGLTGKACGVNEKGYLLIQDSDEIMHSITA